jgi:hypothetical protein
MKVVLLFTSLLFSTILMAQKKGDANYRQPYIAGVRLDSVNCKYIQVTTFLKGSNAFVFFYGATIGRGAEVRDQLGSAIYFYSVADLLNVFDENGWEYLDKLPPEKNEINLLLKKKNN